MALNFGNPQACSPTTLTSATTSVSCSILRVRHDLITAAVNRRARVIVFDLVRDNEWRHLPLLAVGPGHVLASRGGRHAAGDGDRGHLVPGERQVEPGHGSTK